MALQLSESFSQLYVLFLHSNSAVAAQLGPDQMKSWNVGKASTRHNGQTYNACAVPAKIL